MYRRPRSFSLAAGAVMKDSFSADKYDDAEWTDPVPGVAEVRPSGREIASLLVSAEAPIAIPPRPVIRGSIAAPCTDGGGIWMFASG